MSSRLHLLSLLTISITACNLPRDTAGTLDRVKGGVIRVGMVVDTPWVTDSADAAGGIEGAIVASLAKSLGSRIVWTRAPESQLLQSLEQRQLDIVIGGFTAALPWAKELAFTEPYYTDTIVVGGNLQTHPGGNPKGQRVAFREGDPIGAVLRKKEALPIPVRDLKQTQELVAAPMWKMQSLGRMSTGFPLEQQMHVLAVAPGENAWQMRVEQAAFTYRTAIPSMLRDMAK